MEFREAKRGHSQPTTQEALFYQSDSDHPRYYAPQRRSQQYSPWYSPRTWSRKVWVGLIVGIVVVIVIAIVVPVTVTRTGGNSSYPDYAELAYSLAETCEEKSRAFWFWRWNGRTDRSRTQTKERTSLIPLITSLAMTRVCPYSTQTSRGVS